MMASGGDADEEEREFVKCGYCGKSSLADDDGFDFGSAFAKSSGKATVDANTARATETIKLLTCTRCKTIAYCSNTCQRNDYPNHKRACRKIGRDREKNISQVKLKTPPPRPNNSTTPTKVEPLPKKGVPAPHHHPRTAITDPIKPATMNKYILLHCDSETSPAFDYTGVYSPHQRGPNSISYVYDDYRTDTLYDEMSKSSMNWTALEQRGGHYLYITSNRNPRALLQTPNGTWRLESESGLCFSELEVPRSRDVSFFEDPRHLLFMKSSDVYSRWSDHTSSSVQGNVNIALTPVETLKEAARMVNSTTLRPPLKYCKALDFSAWNRDFVLHVDPRSCKQVPLSWIDELTGVYSLAGGGKVVNGYPTWSRQPNLTAKLIDSMSAPVKEFLEEHGIRVNNVDSNKHPMLYVRKENDSSPSILTMAEDFNDGCVRKRQRILEAAYVPKSSSLLTEPASLFTSPEEAFSSWRVKYENKWMELHMAFTPRAFFEQTISLASLEAESMENVGDASNAAPQKKKGKKKKKKKKKPPGVTQACEQPEEPPTDQMGTPDEIGSAASAKKDGASEEGVHSNSIGKKKQSRSSTRKMGWVDGRRPKSVKNEGIRGSVEPLATSGTHGQPNTKDVEKSDADAVRHSMNEIIQTVDQLDDDDVKKEVIQQLLDIQENSKFRPCEAPYVLQHLASLANVGPSKIPPATIEADDSLTLKDWSIDETLQALLEAPHPSLDPSWLSFDDTVTSLILQAAASNDDCEWIQSNSSDLVILFSKHQRKEDLVVLLEAGVCVSAVSVAELLSSLPRGRGEQWNNKITRLLCSRCKITLENPDEFGVVIRSASHTVGKGTRKELTDALKRASADLNKAKKQSARERVTEKISTKNEPKPPVETVGANNEEKVAVITIEKKAKVTELKVAKIQAALGWYTSLLDELKLKASAIKEQDSNENENENGTSMSLLKHQPATRPRYVLTSEEVAVALSTCDTEDDLATLESSIDIYQWDGQEWTIDITEQAHKWFTRHIKRDRALVERIIRRLTLLSTGRWPYVLCKSLKTKKIGCNGKKISLYETKVNSGSRIVWEVALAFSPRRSSLEQNYCEQVIRVWDIVLDHDNLSRAIEQTIERIEKSHLRGEECALFAQLDKRGGQKGVTPSKDGTGVARIPRVFPMKNEVVCAGRDQPAAGALTQHFHPASEDPRQFTLLKFYELNKGAISILLDGQDDNVDLPFTPGPKEHEIIHYESDPRRSILLMGRSGTGKTTCLVFRMWAQHASSAGEEEETQLRQLFLTKNDVLCREVERSFGNMGLAWKRRGVDDSNPEEYQSKQTHFVTSSEWLEALDNELPGERFFTQQELEQRIDDRKQMDAVTKGVESLLSEGMSIEREKSSCRQELTYAQFRKMWRRIKSGSGSNLEPLIVYREIKSFIKGSVPALHIGDEDRSQQQNRFLSLSEYLAVPRKQSRIDETQRREVYDLFVRYEKLKRECGYFDECDLVYNIAGRIELLSKVSVNQKISPEHTGLLPIDSLFVDEVQDFTQAELYILAKICRDPNSLFLAGDTAQSISLGVDFRFTDLRQIFYNSFGGVEPKLLQLSHNYRSHAGVLRLAASVVELLYFFFGNSLDKLPLDLGLFSGPKPSFIQVTSTADLILMLDGAKRETSRIEFGAHQVVIVRSEEAKRNLPDEFGVDKDWVMTVQQSKDAWRVVSNYTEEDIKQYYSGISVESSGVQKYDWEDDFLSTRHLDFDSNQHKILETELKMLYTAITRARVNVFIAETDLELSRPMFSYFQRRAVVDVVSKDSSDGLSGVRVFGVGMNSLEDWKKRGEYYLQNAEGDRQLGCLRLAAKCFDKSGDVKRRDFAVAYLAFTELEEQEYSKKRGKQSTELREKLYDITGQLLEARDVAFLNKAALCLLRTGNDHDAARMFELYARICYTQRIYDSKITISPPSTHEKKYFSYAATLFAKCAQRVEKSMAIDSFRCYLCAEMYSEATQLLNANIFPLQEGKTFQELSNLCLTSRQSERDPIASFQKKIQESAECTSLLRSTINQKAKIGCRILSNNGDDGFSSALGLLSSRAERIGLLSSIASSADAILLMKPWSSNHVFTYNKSIGTESKKSKDAVKAALLISELKADNRHEEVVGILEERGCLLEAADLLEDLSSDEEGISISTMKAFALRVKHVELMLLSQKWKQSRESLAAVLQGADNIADVDTRCSSLLSSVLLSDEQSQLPSVVTKCEDSILWQHRAVKLACSRGEFLSSLPGSSLSKKLTFVYNLAKKMANLSSVLCKSDTLSLEETVFVSNAERYFELDPMKMNSSLLQTKPIVNSRLREVLHFEQSTMPFSPGGSSGLTQSVNREGMHEILSKFIHGQAVSLLVNLRKVAEVSAQRKKDGSNNSLVPIADLQEHIQCLGIRLLCKKEVAKSINQKKAIDPVVSELIDILLHERRVPFVIDADDDSVQENDNDSVNAIVVKRSVVDCIFRASRSTTVPAKSKKCDIMQLIVQWRINNLYKGVGFANKSLLRELDYLEKHVSPVIQPYFVNKRKQIFPRLWLWVVENPMVMNSISVTERIIRTSSRDGLVTLSKSDQVSLLEVNVVSLFASLNLRYSEANSPPILIPKNLFLRGLLTGDTGILQLQGLGVCLKDLISTYCHGHFGVVFQDVVAHLETSADIILSNDLLSVKGNDDSQRFANALTLSAFICCNALIFSTAAKDMDRVDFERDPLTLPSLPLQGNIKKLVAKLRQLFTEDRLHPILSVSMPKPPESFLDLAVTFDRWLTAIANDQLVLCQLKQQEEDSVHVQISESLDEVQSLLASVSFDVDNDVFNNPFTRNIAFLDNAEQDDIDHGQKSDELNAGRTIARFIESKVCPQERFDFDHAVLHFKRWKLILRTFIRQVEILAAKRGKVVQEQSSISGAGNDSVPDKLVQCVLGQVTNPYRDIRNFHQRTEMIKSSFYNANADGIGCIYCGLVNDKVVNMDRFNQWDLSGRMVPFPMFAQLYNKSKFGDEVVYHPGLEGHMISTQHHDNVISYRKKMDEFAMVMARFAMSFELLSQIVRVCDYAGTADEADSIWYFSTAEESRELASRLTKVYGDLSNAGIIWSRAPMHQYLWELLHRYSGLPQIAESFFEKKVDEEKSMKQKRMDDSADSEADVGVENPIQDLMSGPYLNPDALAFIPTI